MTAITRRLLRIGRPDPNSLHPFSSSSASDNPPGKPEPEPESLPKPLFSSSFSDVRATLQREPPPPQHRRPPSSFSPPAPTSSFFDEIRRNLAEYRSRSTPPSPSSTSNYVAVKPPAGRSFDAIRESLSILRPDKNRSDSRGNIGDQTPLSRIQESLNVKPGENFGGNDGLSSFLAKEKIGGEDGNVGAVRPTLVRMYNYSELGAKLKALRPEKKKGKWFSLQELNERLAKLKEVEERESRGRVGGVSWRDLKETMAKVVLFEEEKTKKKTMQRLNILDQLGGTPNYELSVPKDHLVEKYFHPDNMSSAEKLKLELNKVRDEFKMSESDCGSARVQVAQLTVKIKHLSTVLHKKDKHSRRGLEAMVQRRKKLLKYLRRTDWDSYCFVLSKLGLRDRPDFKT